MNWKLLNEAIRDPVNKKWQLLKLQLSDRMDKAKEAICEMEDLTTEFSENAKPWNRGLKSEEGNPEEYGE
jgi:hypothetical protein